MQDNHVDNFLILRVLKGYRMYNKPTHIPSCVYVDPYLDSTQKQKVEGIIAEGLRAAVSRNAVICEGEKSTGKNVYLETISWLMGMPMYLITFSRQMSPSSIYGEKTTDNSVQRYSPVPSSPLLCIAYRRLLPPYNVLQIRILR